MVKLQSARFIFLPSLLCFFLPGLLCFFLLLFSSCRPSSQAHDLAEGDTVSMKYARNLLMVKYENGIDVQLRNPWDTTQLLHRYWLTEEKEMPDDSLVLQNGGVQSAACIMQQNRLPFPGSTEVRIPLRRACVFTAVHGALLDELGCLDAVVGFCEPELVLNPRIRKKIEQGECVDLGSGLNPNLERIVQSMSDAVMPSPFQDNGGYGRLESIGVPIIECADYMEVSPLARAEWVKFYGLLFGQSERADSLFEAVVSSYSQLKEMAEKCTGRPTLMVEQPYSGTWFTAGGGSTMGILYRDAGAKYLWEDTPQSGSLALSPETVLERAMEAEFWLIKYSSDRSLTYQQIQDENVLAQYFRAYKNRNVYACNVGKTPFFEDTPFHPERLLADLIRIFHSELSFLPNYSYFCSVKN